MSTSLFCRGFCRGAYRISLLILASAVLAVQSLPAHAVDLRLNAFGDFTLAFPFGPPASQQASDDFNAYGMDPFPKNSLKGFGLTGTDFVLTADIQDNLVFQNEINFQVARGQSTELEIDIERMYLDYLIIPQFNVMAGLYFTPIGYMNRNLYARAWMMRGIQIHQWFEEEYGFVPTHSIGVSFHGAFQLGAGHSLLYALSIGNGRAPNPDQVIYSRDSYTPKEYTALLEWRPLINQDLRVGVSGWTDQVNSVTSSGYGSGVGTGQMQLSDWGINPYVVFEGNKVGFIAEYIWDRMKDETGTLNNESFVMQAVTLEAAYKMLDRRLQAFVRYDGIWLPTNAGPYYGLRNVDTKNLAADRYYVPASNFAITGLVFDVTPSNRLKVEYLRALTGPTPENRLAFQTAFAF